MMMTYRKDFSAGDALMLIISHEYICTRIEFYEYLIKEIIHKRPYRSICQLVND